MEPEKARLRETAFVKPGCFLSVNVSVCLSICVRVIVLDICFALSFAIGRKRMRGIGCKS